MEYKYHIILMIMFFLVFSLSPGISFIVVGENNKVWNANSNRTECIITNTYIVEVECPSPDTGGGGGGGSGDRKRYDVNACYSGVATYNYLIIYYQNKSITISAYDYPSVANYMNNNYKIDTDVFCWYNINNLSDMELTPKTGSGFTITGEVFIGTGLLGSFIWCTILLVYYKRNDYIAI